MKRLAALAAGLGVAAGAIASDDAQWYLQVDNDVVFGTDRWYTSGLRLARSHRAAEPSGNLERLAHEVLKPSGAEQRFECGIVQEIYTPETERAAPGVVDRPYAARLFASFARHDFSPERFQTLEVDAGVRGPAAFGRQSQAFMHRFIPAPHVDWSRQLANRFDAQAIISQSRLFPIAGAAALQWALNSGVVLGNLVSLGHVGAELRWGSADSATLWNPLLRFAATPPVLRPNMSGWSAFAGASARVVARNELLTAPAGDAPLARNRGVLRLAGGLAWAQPWGLVTFALAQDSREFEAQRTPHRFGVLAIHLTAF